MDNRFEIKDGVLICYKRNEHTVYIPDSVSVIGENAFNFYYAFDWQWNSGRNEFPNDLITEIHVPASVRRIEANAFGNCRNLRRIIFEDSRAIDIDDMAFGSVISLADTDGTYILNDTLYICISPVSGIAVIPQSVKRISEAAMAKFTGILSMPLECPVWTGKLIFNSDTQIQFTDECGKVCAQITVCTAGEAETVRKAFAKAMARHTHEFAFSEFDGCFGALRHTGNKVKMAVTRLKTPYGLDEKYRKIYTDFIKENDVRAGKYCLEHREFDLFTDIAKRGLMSHKAISELARWTTKKKDIVTTAFVLDIGNRYCTLKDEERSGELRL